MKAFIVQFPFGVLAFGEDNQLVEEVLYPKNPQQAAKALIKAETGKLDHINELITKLQTAGYDSFVFDNEKTAGSSQSPPANRIGKTSRSLHDHDNSTQRSGLRLFRV